jgi:hypothetical protein
MYGGVKYDSALYIAHIAHHVPTSPTKSSAKKAACGKRNLNVETYTIGSGAPLSPCTIISHGLDLLRVWPCPN